MKDDDKDREVAGLIAKISRGDAPKRQDRAEHGRPAGVAVATDPSCEALQTGMVLQLLASPLGQRARAHVEKQAVAKERARTADSFPLIVDALFRAIEGSAAVGDKLKGAHPHARFGLREDLLRVLRETLLEGT